MSKSYLPRFPRGFLLSERPASAPPTYISGPILPYFYVHPWTNVEVAGDRKLFVIILGHCVSTQSCGGDGNVAKRLLELLYVSDSSLLHELDDYSGRYVVIFGSVGNIRIVNDASSMRSVFYAVTGGVAASHPILVEHALGGLIVKERLPFRYGYPGNKTPFTRTRILTPNTYYWLSANVIRRFWPLTSLRPRTVDQAARELLSSSTKALCQVASNRFVGLTLTAGLDSRAILAIAIHAGIDFSTYTYGHTAANEIDRAMGAELARYFGFRHIVVGDTRKNHSLTERLRESHYALHHGPWVGALMHFFNDTNALAVLGNSLEIGRSNFSHDRRRGATSPITAKSMAELHYRRLGDEVRKEVESFGQEPYLQITEEAFQSFIDDTGFNIVAGILDPFDQFYWEHRMATWQGIAMGERDFYAVPYIPFNSRRVFAALLGVPDDLRHQNIPVKRMIEMVDTSLMDFPINPKRWPTESQ